MKWSLGQLLDKKTTPPKITRVYGKRTVADSSWMQHDPQPTNRARMSPPDMNSTVVDNGTTFPILIDLNETDMVSGAGFIDPIRLGDSPVGGARRKQAKGAKRSDYPKDTDPTSTRDFTNLTAEKKAIRDDKTARDNRRDTASCYYDSKCRNRFTVNLPDRLKTELSLD